MSVFRFTTTGAPDLTFINGLGQTTVSLGVLGTHGYAVAVQPDGKVVSVGATAAHTAYAIARFTATGGLDGTFAGGGITSIAGHTSTQLNGVLIQPDGKILAVGQDTTGGNNFISIVRLTTAGLPDPAVGTGSGLVNVHTLTNSTGMGVALQANGKIIVGGFSDSGGNSSFTLARFNSADCSLDAETQCRRR